MAVVLFNVGNHYCTTIISIDDDIDSDDHGDDTTLIYSINIIQLYFIRLTSEFGLFLISSWGCFLKVGCGTTADNSVHFQCVEWSSISGRVIHRNKQVDQERFESSEASIPSSIKPACMSE